MTVTTIVPASADRCTFADLLDRLGNIPAQRVRVSPAPGTASEEDVLAALDDDRWACELIDGVLVEKAMGARESFLASWINFLLMGFVTTRKLGIITGEQGILRLFAGRIRVPDLAYISWERIPGRQVPETPIPELIPNLAVEVLSISNTAAEMTLKRHDYFQAGVELVWEVDPRTRTITIYTAPESAVILREGEMLNGGAVLPGFEIPVLDVFAKLDPQ